jgi:hypothetical protein
MSWNYRVVRTEDGLRIFDVYYDDNGQPVGTHEQPTYIYGASIEELRNQLALIKDALDQPILEAGSIGNRGHVA